MNGPTRREFVPAICFGVAKRDVASHDPALLITQA
jgi:hypothetical protein